jgi:N-methylhydantoinase B
MAEVKTPCVVESLRLIPDSGGPGRYRGGLGVERVVRARAPCVFSSQIERAHCKPWGLEGGGEAAGNSIGLRIDGKWKDDFPNAKMVMANLKVGDAYVLRSGGGGGYGPAWERPAERVAEDVRQGYISIESAAEDYGVVVDAKSFAVDNAATEKRRAALRKQGAAAAE